MDYMMKNKFQVWEGREEKIRVSGERKEPSLRTRVMWVDRLFGAGPVKILRNGAVGTGTSCS